MRKPSVYTTLFLHLALATGPWGGNALIAQEQASLPQPSVLPADSPQLGEARPLGSEASPPVVASPPIGEAVREVSINFNNVSIIEYIRFIGRLAQKNFIFNEEDLQFQITLISEQPSTVENLMAALLQELTARNLSLTEQGNNILIYPKGTVRAPARVVEAGLQPITDPSSELVTRVFRLNALDPVRASEIIRPLLSDDTRVEVVRDTNTLVVTGLLSNVNRVAELMGALDAPHNGVIVGQFVVRQSFAASLAEIATKILQPIAQGNPFLLVPHPVSNSIFIVSNPFLVDRALALLQQLDTNQGQTTVFALEGLRPYHSPEIVGGGGIEEGIVSIPEREAPGLVSPEGIPLPLPPPVPTPISQEQGTFGPETSIPLFLPPSIAPEGELFAAGVLRPEERPSAIFREPEQVIPGRIAAHTRWLRELPQGHIERTLFFIYKLRYRKGDQIEVALRQMSVSLQAAGMTNADLLGAINSVQWLESSNAMVFTGTTSALEKVRELILELDTPLRQVFIEMLILDTTIQDSLTYSVDWINGFGGGSTTGQEGFLSTPLAIGDASENAFVSTAQAIQLPIPPNPFPVATNFLNAGGFTAGVIGTHLTHNGTRFSSIGALVRAVHRDTKANILLNPKIITEDNNTAEIFVGGTDRYKTQSIANDLGAIVTNNFQFIDVGTTLRVTPLIGNHGVITLEIIQETTAPSAGVNSPLSTSLTDVNLVEVLTKTRTVTKIHVPNGFFVILSGMISDNDLRSYSRIPCLGGIPILGGLGKSQTTHDSKRNLMLFIRPLIVESEEEIEDLTRRQQDIYREKSKFRRPWNYEIDESLNFLNIKPTDRDEIGCSER